jgi:hypothetical protein
VQDASIAADLWQRHGENSNYPLHEAVLYCDTELVRYIIRLMQLIHKQWGHKRTAIANITNKYVLHTALSIVHIGSVSRVVVRAVLLMLLQSCTTKYCSVKFTSVMSTLLLSLLERKCCMASTLLCYAYSLLESSRCYADVLCTRGCLTVCTLVFVHLQVQSDTTARSSWRRQA